MVVVVINSNSKKSHNPKPNQTQHPQKISQPQKVPESSSRPAPIAARVFVSEGPLPIMKAPVKHLSPQRGYFKVVIRKVERPFKNDFENQLAWICSTLGFFEPIDKDKNAAAVFKEIILATENGEALTSTALAQRIGMSRGSVLNHLNNLHRSGLIDKHGRFYSARSVSMKRTIDDIQQDVERIFAQLKKSAEEVDKQFGIEDED